MRKVLLLLYTVALAMGCNRGPSSEPQARLSRQQFVTVMIELESAQPAGRAAVLAVLAKHKVTEADLKEFVQKYADAPDYLSLAFDSIQVAVDRAQPGR